MDSIGYLGIFLGLLGALGALWAWRAHGRAKAGAAAAQRWLVAPGKILSCEVAAHHGGTGTKAYSYYTPNLVYSYSIAGRERRGTRLRFGMPTSRSRAGIEAMLKPYPAGADIQVRYDPDNPDEAVLVPETAGNNLLIAAVACMAVCAGGVLIVVLAVMGLFTADVSGHWHVHFQDGGGSYDGELQAERGAGPLSIAYNDNGTAHHITEDCRLERNGQHVLVTCTNVQGDSASYQPDNFDLVYQDANHLSGTIASAGGGASSVGQATFTR